MHIENVHHNCSRWRTVAFAYPDEERASYLCLYDNLVRLKVKLNDTLRRLLIDFSDESLSSCRPCHGMVVHAFGCHILII